MFPTTHVSFFRDRPDGRLLYDSLEHRQVSRSQCQPHFSNGFVFESENEFDVLTPVLRGTRRLLLGALRHLNSLEKRRRLQAGDAA